MDKDRVIKSFRSIFDLIGKRVGILYLIVFLIFSFFIGGNFKVASDIQALNRIMPPFDPLVEFMEKGTPMDDETLDQQILYFKSVLKHMKGFSAADEMLGVSYYYRGEKNLAEKSLNDAVETNSDVFWFLYNQGLFYYKNKNYPKAIESFKRSLQCDPKKTIQFMFSSKIYLPIFLASKLNFSEVLAERLQQGYSLSYRFIIESYLQQEDYQSVVTHAMAGVQSNLDQQGIYHYYVGMAAYNLKDFKTAIYYLQESVKRNSTYANAFYYLGMSVQAIGNDELANKFLEQAKRLRTDRDSLQEELNHKNLQVY